MGSDRIQGNWREKRGEIREQWGKLTDDDLDHIDGQREQLLGTLQQRYGKARNVVESEVRDFERRRDMVSEKGTGLEGSIGTSGRTGSDADGGSVGGGGRTGGYTEPSDIEKKSGSRGEDAGWSGGGASGEAGRRSADSLQRNDEKNRG